MKTDTSRVSKAYRQIFFAVPLTVIALVALLVIASTNSSLLDRYFYDILDAPHHGTRAISVLDRATFYFSLYPQVAFYTGNGVYDNSF